MKLPEMKLPEMKLPEMKQLKLILFGAGLAVVGMWAFNTMAAASSVTSTRAQPVETIPLSEESTSTADAPEPEPTFDGIDERTQYEFFEDLLEAQGHDEARHYRSMRERWLGRRFRWGMQRIEPLCRGARCFVAPFDFARTPGDTERQGFLPVISLDEEAQRSMEEVCASHAPCVVEFEGTLSELVLRTARPVRMGLTDIRVLGGRSVGPDERWLR